MNDKIGSKDYISLWKYFEDESSNVKGAMFTTVTWIIGFAAALLAFIFSNFADYSPDSKLSLTDLALFVCFTGLALCMYAFYAIRESAKHIRTNWTYANRCMEKVDELKEIVEQDKNKEECEKEIYWDERYLRDVKICKRLAVIVYLFGLAFLAVPIIAFNL